MPKERGNTSIPNANILDCPSDAQLELIEQKYIQALEAEPIEINSPDIHHDEEGLEQYIEDLKPFLPKRFNTREEDRAMFEANDRSGLFFSVAMIVVKQAIRRKTDRVSAMDLVQVGNMAIWEDAIRTYKPEKAKFSTWATWWIRHAQGMEVKRNFSEYKISPRDVDDLRKVQKNYSKFMVDKGRKPTDLELGGLTGIEPARASYLIQMENKHSVPLSKTVARDGEIEYSEVLKDPNALGGESLERKIAYNETLKAVYRESLNFPARNKRNAEILMLRLGCNKKGEWTGKVWSSTEIGKKFGVTRERAKQLQTRAVNLIKDPELREIIRAYFEPKN